LSSNTESGLASCRVSPDEFYVLYNMQKNKGGLVELTNHGDFVKYLDVVMCMPGESTVGVWIANYGKTCEPSP
jgi:hypothetical protein